jgi:hypothetical protein
MSAVSQCQRYERHSVASAGASEKWFVIISRAVLVVPVFSFTRNSTNGQYERPRCEGIHVGEDELWSNAP